jgi:hypothetical protein
MITSLINPQADQGFSLIRPYIVSHMLSENLCTVQNHLCFSTSANQAISLKVVI